MELKAIVETHLLLSSLLFAENEDQRMKDLKHCEDRLEALSERRKVCLAAGCCCSLSHLILRSSKE